MPDFESDLLRVLVFEVGCGVERPEALSSDALPGWVGAGFGRTLGTGLVVDVVGGGGAYFAVLRCIFVSIEDNK